ncbi:PREDICTED: protein retinal degeneration B isoform X1 [Trachymyrmex septentrionalis]|uniref:protein retinal degeneration B isoform X1 n=1 Tax=Trachymyrmex septentrionalis TaxID=34720 RepID=UPI00084F7FF7|nr:PREDICTED: protein retinal degeneration B isoform X1 [Trachymyrmex septentrionalis]XP_018341093.1 PREDICTED: protein retinal degeneration B isoform X1 [Trachymyrmex septentrionalis]XP_018341094.1 PREDICTED: protein retinal degeneration B isoform X1 [Trachymyrmex septentrionalis]XP_018341095.1 PREDICTED: protein retinal degeneration B isoform X1 [Trachymyrmex septentrionalis]XP_018341096.1 PREDICTED: protein retinal degeneration B isoform X1 [Trachymyrmex septentrionalis]
MLIKEYRIPLPLTVEEYRIAQLYMIAKKSREESKGAGSGVEIIENEPYSNGPGGNGQYTHKIYHVGSHLPGWFKSLLPKSALIAKEEAWNAYPYTKTRYTCPFVAKFSVEIETYYFPDDGHQENVFNLTGSDYRNRIVDIIDIVKDQPYGADYVKEEDPKLYVSEKTGRGPLEDTWLEDYWADVEGKQQPTPSGKSLMCAYKLCRVEFHYWGMQTKLEKFIHDVALRKTMVRAHRQAWAWQDEWNGLTMEDIREIERQTQLALQRKMGLGDGSEDELEDGETRKMSATATTTTTTSITTATATATNATMTSEESAVAKTLAATLGSIEKNEEAQSPPSVRKPSDIPIINTAASSEGEISPEDSPIDLDEIKNATDEKTKKKWTKNNMPVHSPNTNKNFDIQLANWRLESIVRESESGSDDEFFDCQEDFEDSSSLAKWSSLDLLAEGEDTSVRTPSVANEQEDTIFSPSYLQRITNERSSRRLQISTSASIDVSCPASPQHSPTHQPCKITVLIIVIHGGSVLDANVDLTAKKSDITTFRGAFESIMRQHYPSMVGHVSIKFVACPSICTEGLGILSSLSPYSFDMSPSCMDAPQVTHDTIPIGAIPLLASSSSEYQDTVSRVVMSANQVYHDFIKSDEGKGFSGQICFVSDSVGSILTYDALCKATQHSRHSSENSILEGTGQQGNDNSGNEDGKHLSAPSPRRRSSGTNDNKLDFEVGDFFMFGSPLALVLAYRKITASSDRNSFIPRPLVNQVYNLFHPTEPVAARLEPLISARFSLIAPVNIAEYGKYPLGNGQPYHLLETIQTNPQLYADGLNVPNFQMSHLRRLSDISLQSTMSGIIDNVPLQAVSALMQKWWGTKRLDYALYCPEGLTNFPTNALPHIFHASYWESPDVIAFILRQLGRVDAPLLGNEEKDLTCFRPGQPREKWNKKRTSVKIKNVAANHRANDVIVREGVPQILVARFMYSPIDMITLTGEKVDIHIMKNAPAGEWTYLSTEVTDKNGRIIYKIPDDKTLGYGLYPIKMIVRGDHTSVDFFVAVIPPRTECVVFSIDGSFAASKSVSGKDPKVWAGAVDVVRHWQELGYLIIYITARPDMQQQTVVSWLSQHNFPHGLVSFADGLSRDPLAHKAAYLNKLVKEHGMIIHQAYGSEKDINVYTAVSLKPSQIFIIGKVSKKHQAMATILYDGYAAHLSILQAHGGSRPAQGNARMVIPRGQFILPGQNASLRRRSSFRTAKRAISQPPLGKTSFPLERSSSVDPSIMPASSASVHQSATTEKL